MGFQQRVIEVALIGLFAFALIYFAVNVGIDNNSSTILNDPTMNATFISLNKTLPTYQGIGQAQMNATTQEPITVGFGSIILYSIKTAGTIFSGVITGIYNIFVTLIGGTLHLNPIITSVIGFTIFVSLILLMWRVWRSGY